MENIVTGYIINEVTMNLMPAAAMDYATIVWERDRIVYVKEKPLELIKLNCLNDYSTYEGKRMAVSHHIGAKRKIPIPVNKEQNIYAFPTHSPTIFECHWIFYHHVQSIHVNPNAAKERTQSIITFKNGQQLPMNESYYVLEKQLLRTARCMLQFSS